MQVQLTIQLMSENNFHIQEVDFELQCKDGVKSVQQ